MIRELFFICLVIQVTSSYENVGNTCCPLVWAPLRNDGMVPSNAFEIGKLYGQSRYWSRIDDSWSNSHHILGLKTETSYHKGWFLSQKHDVHQYDDKTGCMRYKGNCKYYGRNDNTVVLTNPLGCVHGWWKREATKQLPDSSSRYEFPKVTSHFFARYEQGDNGHIGGFIVDQTDDVSNNAREFVSMDGYPNPEYYWKKRAGPEAMYIDCVQSLKTVVKAELFDLEFDLDLLLDGKEEVVLQSAEVINNSTSESSSEISLEAKIEKSLQMSYTTTASHSVGVSFSEEVSVSAEKLASLGFKRGLDYNFQHIAQEGKVNIESNTTTFTFKQIVVEPPRTKTRVSIVSTPVSGSIPLKGKYRISSIHPEIFSNENVRQALDRIGFADYDKIKVQSNGSLLLEYDGYITVKSGYNTRVIIQSFPLDDAPK